MIISTLLVFLIIKISKKAIFTKLTKEMYNFQPVILCHWHITAFGVGNQGYELILRNRFHYYSDTFLHRPVWIRVLVKVMRFAEQFS